MRDGVLCLRRPGVHARTVWRRFTSHRLRCIVRAVGAISMLPPPPGGNTSRQHPSRRPQRPHPRPLQVVHDHCFVRPPPRRPRLRGDHAWIPSASSSAVALLSLDSPAAERGYQMPPAVPPIAPRDLASGDVGTRYRLGCTVRPHCIDQLCWRPYPCLGHDRAHGGYAAAARTSSYDSAR
jgi:hypothetical protein